MDMEQMATIGLDIAKSVFQVHGVGKNGSVVVQRRLRRSQVLGFFSKQSPCVVGIEACASSHFWACEIGALGNDVRLMPAAYVKPYVKRQKNDAADAETICEAATPWAATKPATFGPKPGGPALRQQEKLCYKGCAPRIILKTSGGFGPLRHLRKPHGQRWQ
jgi:hypothetical protein